MNQLVEFAAVGCLAMMGVMMAMTLRSNRSSINTTLRHESGLPLAEIDRLSLEPESKANNAPVFGNHDGGKVVANRALLADEPWPPRLM